MFSGDGKSEEESSGSSSSSSDSDSSDNEATAVVPQEHFVQLSLLRNPPQSVLGSWEKHTTVLKKIYKNNWSILKLWKFYRGAKISKDSNISLKWIEILLLYLHQTYNNNFKRD